MLLDLILILVAAVFAILAGAALLGAGAFVVASHGRWRKARKAAHDGAVLNLFAEIAHPPIFVGDFGQMEPLPEALYDVPLSADDLTVIRMAGTATFGTDARITLPSGRKVTGAELAELHQRQKPVPARPNALGGWVRIGDERVHRSCEQAYPAGLVCSYCLPILVVHARSVTP